MSVQLPHYPSVAWAVGIVLVILVVYHLCHTH